MQTFEDILFEEIPGTEGGVGVITLNRPKALNALNLPMFLALDNQLKAWDEDKTIKAVIVKAVPGRAFCAGGDIRAVYEAHERKDPNIGEFFRVEYDLNARIFHYSKPYVALLNGITMGGGVGISIHASHRVATENFLFAMPETGIGFYPDVTSTYFLPRLPGKVGYYIGLTGERLKYEDCYELGIVNHLAAEDDFPKIINLIVDTPLAPQPKKIISEILSEFRFKSEKSALLEKRTAIDTCFAKESVEEIIEALIRYPDVWCSTLASQLRAKSPTSLKVTLRQLQTGEKLSFDECSKLESHITAQFLKKHDFFEGIRAVIIDKDNKPKWKPSQLEKVNEEMIDKYFQVETRSF